MCCLYIKKLTVVNICGVRRIKHCSKKITPLCCWSFFYNRTPQVVWFDLEKVFQIFLYSVPDRRYTDYKTSAWCVSVISTVNERTWAGQGSTCVWRQSSSRRAKAESIVTLSAQQLSTEICNFPASSSTALSLSPDHRLLTHWHKIQELACLWVAKKCLSTSETIVHSTGKNMKC